MAANDWWRDAVIYQVYPRSFADGDGDGMGDLPGITARLPHLRDLGIDAVWLSPFYPSPQHDAGYDVADYRGVDPRFGDLGAADKLIAKAHELGLKFIVDLVPNHTSNEHDWFRAALGAAPGSPERDRYIFREGRGDQPPNSWESVFGGSAWERVPDGWWYLHLFDVSQPDLNWGNPEVRAEFVDVLRFWLDRGVDGFRVDVAHGLSKEENLADWTGPSTILGGLDPLGPPPPMWDQEGVHDIYREWRSVLDEYPGGRILVAEAWVQPLSRLARYVREDEMHQAFNFAYLETEWDAAALRKVVTDSLRAFGDVGAPSTWVLSNHDVVRHATRLSVTEANPQGHGLGPRSKGLPEYEPGLRRARAATALMLALPGSSYLYQGEELGLPEVIHLPDDARQDPTWFRTAGERYGRDGCRVPIPWDGTEPSYGFGPTDASWLPQPAQWASLARDAQRGIPGSTLALYRDALRLRREHALGAGTLEWLPGFPESVVALRNGPVVVVANTGTAPVELPGGEVLLASGPLDGRTLPHDTTAWLRS